MMRLVFTFLAILGVAFIGELVLAKHSNSLEWNEYKRQHGKVYATPEEDAQRFALFLATKDKIRRHNANPHASYKLGLNQFADWTEQDSAKFNGLRHDILQHKLRVKSANDDAFVQSILNVPTPLPAEVDWTKVANRVGPVKNEGECHSSWAFVTTGVLEGQQVASNQSTSLIPLSEQNLLDCSKSGGDCQGGNIYYSFEDILDLGGLMSEKDYPYTGTVDKCKFDEVRAVTMCYGAIQLDEGEDVLKKFVANYGPVAIGVNLAGMKHYSSGIFDDDNCNGEITNWALAVGYGTDPKQGDYWKVKNSWGTKWGEAGYFRIKRGSEMCGMGTANMIAKVVEPDTN